MRLSYDTAKYRTEIANRFGITRGAARLRLSEKTIYLARKYVARVENPVQFSLTFDQWHDQFSGIQQGELNAARSEVKALKGLYLYQLFKNSTA